MKSTGKARNRSPKHLALSVYTVLSGILIVFIGYILLGFPFSETKQATSSNVEQETFYKLLSPSEFKQKINAYTKDEYIILDVRTFQEYNQGHIKGATLVDYYSADFKEKLSRLDKNKIYFVYCRSGNRSAKTVEIMKQLGFKRVYELQGGINSWIASGYQLVKK